jgi:hypothetical protein
MKKLFLILSLMLSISVNAQKATQYFFDYAFVLVVSQGKEPEERKTTTRVFFNYTGDSKKLRIYFNDRVFDFIKTGEVIESKTKNGEEYKGMTMLDTNKHDCFIQVFKDGTLRVVYSDTKLEFYN